MTPAEFNAAARAAENNDRAAWERMRLLAAITIQPHSKRKVTPGKLLPLPWDKEKEEKKITRAEARERFLNLLKKNG